jgi:multidrug efflux pump subunit AcrB
VPQIYLDIDRKKARTLDVPVNSVFSTLQTYLGSDYINDFNFLGRAYEVYAEAEPQFRNRVENIRQLYTRNNSGGMVPLGTLLNVRETVGPDKVMHYNLYPSADTNGATLPGVSSGQAIQMMCTEGKTPSVIMRVRHRPSATVAFFSLRPKINCTCSGRPKSMFSRNDLVKEKAPARWPVPDLSQRKLPLQDG